MTGEDTIADSSTFRGIAGRVALARMLKLEVDAWGNEVIVAEADATGVDCLLGGGVALALILSP